MTRLLLLPGLVVCFACSEIAAPDAPAVDPLSELIASQDARGAGADKWQFEATLTFIGTLEPEEIRITPSGVIHGTDLVNAFEMTGDLEGTVYFIGKYHLNPKTGMGGSVAAPNLIEITSPGQGAFECRSSYKLEGFPTAVVQYGVLTGCAGSGDFAGMRMKAWTSNEANPGVYVYEFVGEIW